MGYETILADVQDRLGTITITITINRPEVRNALSKTVLQEIRHALEDFADRDHAGFTTGQVLSVSGGLTM